MCRITLFFPSVIPNISNMSFRKLNLHSAALWPIQRVHVRVYVQLVIIQAYLAPTILSLFHRILEHFTPCRCFLRKVIRYRDAAAFQLSILLVNFSLFPVVIQLENDRSSPRAFLPYPVYSFHSTQVNTKPFLEYVYEHVRFKVGSRFLVGFRYSKYH